MKNVNPWIVGIVGIGLFLLLGGGMMLGGWGYRPFGMTGPGGMMGTWGGSSYGWMPMVFTWLIPLGVIALVVLGIIWLVRNAGGSKPPSS